MDLKTIQQDKRNSISDETLAKISVARYDRLIGHLTQFRFGKGDKGRGIRPLWEHQAASGSHLFEQAGA
jgi:hypothetical protein